jgi:LmbE family N-acetylglucosaminyl deacetylase
MHLFLMRSRRGLLRFGLQALVSLAGFLVIKSLEKGFRPANVQLAKRYGLQLTRRPRRVLAVTSHADDLEIFATGTLRLLALAGSRITVVVASDGNRQNNRSNIAQIRQQEQRDAGMIIGYDDVRFLGLGDINLSHATGLQQGLEEIWQEIDPDLVLAYDPSHPAHWINHPDHLAIGRAVLNINRTDWGHGTDVLFYGTNDPNLVVDITRTIEDKVQALLAHRSQLKTFPLVYVAAIRGLARFAGRPNQVPYAETFRALSLPVLDDRTEAAIWDFRSERAPAGVTSAPPSPRSLPVQTRSDRDRT